MDSPSIVDIAAAGLARRAGMDFSSLSTPGKDVFREEARAALAAIEASGRVVVPAAPTEEMVAESHRAWDRATLPGPFTIERLYRAMIAAARPRYVAPTEQSDD